MPAKRKAPAKKRKPKTKKPQPRVQASKKAEEAVRLLRTSERSTFERCLWQWYMTYVLHKKPRQEAPALRFGTLVHSALELRYPPGIKRGPKPAETFEQLYHAQVKDALDTWGFKDESGEWDDALSLGIDMLEHYIEHYGRDEEWKVIASEMTFQVPVLGEDGEHLFNYVGTMDGVWENRMSGRTLVNDYKTTKNDPSKEAEAKGTLDEQATAYWTWGVDYLIEQGVLKPRNLESLDGMLYTFLRKQKKDTRPQNPEGHYLNQDGTVSKKQPLPYFNRAVVYRTEDERTKARERVIKQFRRIARAEANPKEEVYKSPGTGYPDEQCKACPVRAVCELHESGDDWKTLMDLELGEWDPYADHEIKEGEQR